MAQEAQARQLELEEERTKREEREAQGAAEEVAEAERNRKRWKRLGQELERVGISLDELASIIMTSDTESLGQLLDGTLPDDRYVWDFDDEMASYVPKMAPRVKLMGGPRWAVVTMPKEVHSSA